MESVCSCCSSQSLGDFKGQRVCVSCIAAYCRPEDCVAEEGECQRCGNHKKAQGWECSCGTTNTSSECQLCYFSRVDVWQAGIEAEAISWDCKNCGLGANITLFCMNCANEAPSGFHLPPGVSENYIPSLPIARPSGAPLSEPDSPPDLPLMPEPLAVLPSPAAIPPANPLLKAQSLSPVQAFQAVASPPRRMDSESTVPVSRPVDGRSESQPVSQVPGLPVPISPPRRVDASAVVSVSKPEVAGSDSAPPERSPPAMSQSAVLPKCVQYQPNSPPPVAVPTSASQIWTCKDCQATNTEAMCTRCHSAMPSARCPQCGRPSSSSSLCPQCTRPKKKGLMGWIKAQLGKI